MRLKGKTPSIPSWRDGARSSRRPAAAPLANELFVEPHPATVSA